MAKVLGIGNATLDIIHVVDRYPEENQEIRCLRRYTRRGGNTANTLVVLSQLGMSCAWAGVVVDNADGALILADLNRYGVSTAPCRILDHGSVPVSTVLISTATGSRTITHYRDLPEYGYTDFAGIEVGRYDWVHFEGRNVAEIRHMLDSLRAGEAYIRCSIEIEKPREGIETLFPYADVLLFSRQYGIAMGCAGPADLIRHVSKYCPRADIFVSWGADGAAARDRQGRIYEAAAFVPEQVVDTLGAGDTFNAAVISGYLEGLDIADILLRGCSLAGRKCGQYGFDGLGSSGRSGFE